MNRKQRDYTDILKKKLLKLLLESEIVHGGHNERAGHLFSLEPDTLSEYYYNVKQALFNDSFAKKYPQYPFLVNRLSPENIEKEIELTIKGIIFGKEEITSSNALNLLFSLGLLDSKKRLDTSTSIYIKEIISCLEKEEGKNVKVEGVFDILGGSPYGLEKELIQLLLVVLTYNGEINMRRKGGGLLTSSEIQHFFSTGMKRFHEIVYVALETEFPVENITQLFKILDMDPGLVKDNKTRTQAVVEFQRQALGMKKKIDKVFLDLNDFRNRPDVFINHDAILRKGQGLESIPIESFLRVKTVADFKRIALNKLQMEKLEIGLRFLQNIQDFLNDFRENIYERYLYVLASLDFVKKHACFFPGEALERLEEKAEGCKEILDNLSHILSFDERRILKGKMEQYQNDYQEIYSDAHRKTVGLEIEWDRLQEMKKSYQLKELFLLSRVLGIHTAPYSQIIFLINKLEQVECHLFRGSHLEREYTCPYCRFPDYQFEPHIMERILHINTTLHDLGEEILKVREDWQDQILQEMENYQDNCQLLSNKEQEVIKGIMEKQRLPEQVTEETVKALNNLFSELQEVEITPSSILEQLFSSSLILDFDTFEENLKNFKSWILSKGERKNIRIKLEKGE